MHEFLRTHKVHVLKPQMATGREGVLQRPRRRGPLEEGAMHGVEGFIYPNEVELQWSVLIVLYPFITGLVAGAFILASLERVFNVVGGEADLPAGAADRAGVPDRRAAAAAAAPRASRALVRDVPDAAPRVGDGDVRVRLPLVPDGRAAARDLVRLPEGHRRWRGSGSTGLTRLLLRRADARLRQHQRRGAAGRRQGRARSSPSSASRRRSCCTATSASSSGRSRRTRGGPRR